VGSTAVLKLGLGNEWGRTGSTNRLHAEPKSFFKIVCGWWLVLFHRFLEARPAVELTDRSAIKTTKEFAGQTCRPAPQTKATAVPEKLTANFI